MLLNETAVCECHAGLSQFITVPIGPQLKARLQSKFCNNRALLDKLLCVIHIGVGTILTIGGLIKYSWGYGLLI